MKTECTASEANSGLVNVFDHLVWINSQGISHGRKILGMRTEAIIRFYLNAIHCAIIKQ